MAQLQRVIKETEFAIEHTSLSVKQEKAAMERVRELKKGKAIVAAFEAEQMALDDAREQHKAQSAATAVKPLSPAEFMHEVYDRGSSGCSQEVPLGAWPCAGWKTPQGWAC